MLNLGLLTPPHDLELEDVVVAGGARMRCPNCGGFFGLRASCRHCGQIDGLPVGMCAASAARRLSALVLDLAVAGATLGVGWALWALAVLGRGQTPGKQLAGIATVQLRTGRPTGPALMLVRELLVKPLVIVATLGLGAGWLLWDSGRQSLYDKLLGSVPVRSD